jgi:transcriptional regulator with XRE-family HTH domain
MLVAASALVRDARRRAGLTQVDLARRTGLSQAEIARVERPGSNPTAATLERVLRGAGYRMRLESIEQVDETLIRQQLDLPPAERLRQVERQAAQMRRLAIAGARSRGELP